MLSDKYSWVTLRCLLRGTTTNDLFGCIWIYLISLVSVDSDGDNKLTALWQFPSYFVLPHVQFEGMQLLACVCLLIFMGFHCCLLGSIYGISWWLENNHGITSQSSCLIGFCSGFLGNKLIIVIAFHLIFKCKKI